MWRRCDIMIGGFTSVATSVHNAALLLCKPRKFDGVCSYWHLRWLWSFLQALRIDCQPDEREVSWTCLALGGGATGAWL
jgi:hypothetical protein